MGLLGWLNRRGQDVLEPDLVDPGFRRADPALEKGAAASGTIVGVEQKLDDTTTTRCSRGMGHPHRALAGLLP